ncbi:hypothetical protein Sjap_024210 [Stephania japonica]|uniref:NAC domain-containing protein n=1 Tax=Stephania japonica TaxID=461633 RepID=A0AAP0HJN5_9MAGN
MENIPGFGFGFHPTDEELITHYLSKKVSDGNFNARAIGESKEQGRNCTPLELYLHVHTKKHDGHTFIDARSERVNVKYERWTSPRLRPRPPLCPSHQETLTPSTAVPTPTLDANDVYGPRMYEPENEEQTNLPLQQQWIDALSDTHPLPRPDRDN